MKYDVIIIGSGLGGLECGYILSRMGRRVLVLEQDTQPGGCMQSYRRHGLAYDTGFHYVGGLAEGQSLHTAFRYLGLLDLPWQRLEAEGFDRITIGDRTFSFAEGFDAFAERLAAEFPAERVALRQYVALLKQCGEEQFATLNPQADEQARASAMLLSERSAYQYLTETFHDPLLVNVLSGASLKMELRKESLPLFTFLHGNSSFIESSWRLKGDSSLIVEALLKGIQAQGGEVVCRAKVEELVERNGRLIQARCRNGEVYEGDLFISDIHPAATCGLVKQSKHMRNIYRKRMASLENTFGMLTVSLRLKPQAIPYFNWNHYIYKEANVWDFYRQGSAVEGLLISCRVPEDGCDAQIIDLLTPLSWQHCAAWCDTQVGRRGESYIIWKEQLADACIDLAERVVPGLRQSVAERYVSTPLTYRDYLSAPEGTAYGVRKDYRKLMQTMLSPRTPIPNLLMTGQNLMLHGLHGVTMTAFFTCAEVVGQELIGNILTNK